MDSVKFCAEERALRAKQYFQEGYNCAQAVALAYADITSLDKQTVATITASFGGGMGRLREVCGAVSGMSFLASFISPCPTADNAAAKKANYALVQEFAEAFRKQNGAIVCRTLLGLDRPKDEPTPSERTAEYYKKRPCADLVYDAALIIGEYLANNQN
ncbi:MAG: C_GCAxxG_C_C family protein [Alistipes sp.]|nr:C_GCAxxG_C_C family protein [Rikenellaceae bacterium]MBR1962465.1 C_GCAxxG_C_C family protein [Alistipes sp.]